LLVFTEYKFKNPFLFVQISISKIRSNKATFYCFSLVLSLDEKLHSYKELTMSCFWKLFAIGFLCAARLLFY